MAVIKDEMIAIKAKYGDERRSVIEYSAEDFRMEDMISDEEVVITISHMGYIKRTALKEYRQQSRGGVGSRGSATRDTDFLEHLFMATNHNYLLIFTEKGKCFWIRIFEIPEGTKTTKGRAIQNLINIEQDDKVRAYINVKDLEDKEYLNNNFIILCTKNGIIKKTSLEAYSRPRQNGINAITVREGDQLLEAALTNGTNEIMLASKIGKVCRFNETRVRPMGRNASGVRGIDLDKEKFKDNEVIGMICLDNKEATVLVVSERGYGKRSEIEEYRITNRGGKGVKTINVTEKTGVLVAIKQVTNDNDLMIITKSGITIRLDASQLRVMGRATQGVRLINLKGNQEIAAVAVVNKDADEEEIDNSDLIEVVSEENLEVLPVDETIENDVDDAGDDATDDTIGTEIENDDVE
jgi:DNA gyrase subunit A